MISYTRDDVRRVFEQWRRAVAGGLGPVLETLNTISRAEQLVVPSRWHGWPAPEAAAAFGIECPRALVLECAGLDCGLPDCPHDATGAFPLLAVIAYAGPKGAGYSLLLNQQRAPAVPYYKLVVHVSRQGVGYGTFRLTHPVWNELDFAVGTFPSHAWTNLMEGGPGHEDCEGARRAQELHLVPHLLGMTGPQ